MLAGRSHELWTGVCLWRKPDGLQIAWQELSRVTMKPMTEDAISNYLCTRQWEGCSGAYAIQEENDPLLTVEGSISNVIGLPMESLARYFSLV
jgi:septum formation protein